MVAITRATAERAQNTRALAIMFGLVINILVE
jgi:hypothetical protein